MIFDYFLAFFQSPGEQKLMIAVGLGALIGLERELAGKDPSLRTFSLICLGSCMFSMISIEAAMQSKGQFADAGRVAAQVVTGIGFLGAGTIFRSKTGVAGLTTAALMWLTAGIGMAVGFNQISLAVSGTLIGIFVVWSLKLVHRIIRVFRPENINSHQNVE